MAGRWMIGALALACWLGCAAQESETVVSESPQHVKETPKPLKGTVSGTVYCADTNAPARVAQVMLVPVAGNDKMRSFQTATQTDLEGRFTIPKVPEGTYYVSVQFAGYRNALPLSRELDQRPITDEERKKLGPGVPKVLVASNQTATVSIRLERGTEIDGTVLYDDGSPAVGLQLELQPKPATASATPEVLERMAFADFLNDNNRATDDRGRFRILGVEPGEYLLGVAVPTASADDPNQNPLLSAFQTSSFGSLVVYYGDTMRASKANTIKVDENDASKDADITIPLSKLHTIRGRVVFKSTGEPAPTAGLELLYADNHEQARIAIGLDGEFQFTGVPEGSYILRAEGMRERLHAFDDDDSSEFLISGVRFEGAAKIAGADIPVVVAGDVSGITISVPDPPAVKPGQGPEPAGPNPAAPPLPQ